MEYSSPLAAMRPQPVPAWGNRRDLPVSRSMYHGCQTYGPNSFDFKNMSMQKQKPASEDYFSLKPIRGSSPASSLMADLDANFHIDKRYPHSSLTRSRTMLTIIAVHKLVRHAGLFSLRTCSSLSMTLVSWILNLIRANGSNLDSH